MSTCAKQFSNNVYLFSPDNDGEIVASRAENITLGKLFGNGRISKSDEDFIISKLHTFACTPLLVTLDGLPTIISICMYPSSGLCLAVSMKVSNRAVLSVISGRNVMISPSYDDVLPASRVSQDIRNTVLEVFNTVMLLNEPSGILRDGGTHNAASLSAMRAGIIFDFIGCELKSSLLLPFGELKDYDISLFTAYIICAAMFVRRATSSRSAELSFYKASRGLTSSLSVSLDDKPMTSEFEFLRKQTELMNIYFCANRQGNVMKIEICPHRPDYSKLGLKNRPKYS